jgi:hypothetical protein
MEDCQEIKKLAVMVAQFSWSPPRIVGVTGNSMNPGAQDPDAQASLGAWITEIRDYLKDNILSDEHVSAEWIVHVAKRYTLVEGDLYRRGTNDVLMSCITWEDDCELLIEIHGGECGNHASYRTLVGKAFLAWLLLAYNPSGFHRAGKEVQGVPVSCQAHPHIDADAANDPILMGICRVGVGHPGSVPQGC